MKAHPTQPAESLQEPEIHPGTAAPQPEPPRAGYAVLLGTFATLVAAFAGWMRISRHGLPERVAAADLALVTVATHKTSRLIAKDRIASTVRAPFTHVERADGTGTVRERPRGEGLQRAVGELVTCPYCLSVWIAAAFTAGLVVAPRPTRWLATALTALFGSDLLQIAYKKAEDMR